MTYELVKVYFYMGLSQKEIVGLLAHNHGIVISTRTFRRILKKLDLSRRKGFNDMLDIAEFISGKLQY